MSDLSSISRHFRDIVSDIEKSHFIRTVFNERAHYNALSYIVEDLHQTKVRCAIVRPLVDTPVAEDKRSCVPVCGDPHTPSLQGQSADLDLVDGHTVLSACVCLGLHMLLNSAAKVLSTI